MYVASDFDVVDVVREVAAERGLPIVGATKVSHLDNAIASIDVALSDGETARLEAPYRPHPILGHPD